LSRKVDRCKPLLLGREHLRSVESHYGDEVVLAERRYMLGMTRPQPTSEAEVTRFEKIFEAGRCWLTVSKPVLKAPMVSALETTM